MMVARQFIAWYPCENGNRPVGNGMIGSDRRVTIRTISQPWVRIRPCPTGRILYGTCSRHKLPGYDHSVYGTNRVVIRPQNRT